MKVLILGAGFGTRLERDLRNDISGNYSQLVGVPKPLLPIGSLPLASHWVEALKGKAGMQDVYVVTNGVNHEAFTKWAANIPQVKLACEGAMSNDTRSGAVACMKFSVDYFQIEDDLMIIAGDTLFFDDFDIDDIIQRYTEFCSKEPKASMVVYVTCSDDEVHKYGILETDAENRVTGFLEKPQPSETTSRKECPCFYILSRHALSMLGQFLEDKMDEPLKARDATGNFIAYLYQRTPVYATEISGRFDVGGLQSYVSCHQHFLKKD